MIRACPFTLGPESPCAQVRTFRVVGLLAALLVPATSGAQGSEDCPPGMYCESRQTAPAPHQPASDAPASDAPAPHQPASDAPAPHQPASDAPASDAPAASPPAGTGESPPGLVIDDPAPSGSPSPIRIYEPQPPPPAPRPREAKRELGVTGGLLLPFMGEDASSDAGMLGVSAGFRYRPVRPVALDAELDLAAGRDWEGNRRRESALVAQTVIFFNPSDPFQAYVLAGLGWSWARVHLLEADPSYGLDAEPVYRYFGGRLGAGVEWRFLPQWACSVDVIGFLRGRTDDRRELAPEFVDESTGIASNASQGAMLRLGAVYYW